MSYPFVQARWYRQGGNLPVTRIVLHDAEYEEAQTGAESIAAYFQRTDKKVSAHAVSDCDSTIECVRDGDSAFHAPPNTGSLGLELMGFAKQTTADWLDDYGVRMLRDQAAPWVRGKAALHNIPLVWLSVEDLKAGKRGITSHNNVSLAFGLSTHTDPGPNFPIAQFLAWVIAPTPPTPPPTSQELTRVFILNPVTDGADTTQYFVNGDKYVPLTGDEAQQFRNSGLPTKDMEPLAFKVFKQTATLTARP